MRLKLVVVLLLCWWTLDRVAAAPPEIEEILDRVERRGDGIEDIRCDVIYVVKDLLDDDVTKREGEILYKKKAPNPLFLIRFDKTVQGGAVSRLKLWYVFDGRWFLEATERSKSIIRRDIAPPGTTVDLFDLDSAPFPIPFGQKKDEILEHFYVAIGPGGGDAPKDTDHLICTPKPTSRFAKDHTKVEFFISRTLNLPVKIVITAKPANRITTAFFPGLSEASLNPGVADGKFALPAETKGYAVSTER